MSGCRPWNNQPLEVWVTNPGSGSQVEVTNWPASQAVTGTFWPGVQPVSGTFWQATQPVSIAAPVAVTGTFWQATQPVSAASLPLPSGAAAETTLAALNTKVTACNTGAVTVASSSLPTGAATEATLSAIGRPSTLCVTGTAATGQGVTLTLPAIAGQFHYLTSLQIRMYATAARTGSATPVVSTTTNLPGLPAFTWETAQAIGTVVTQQLELGGNPLRSSLLNTATTIVCPGIASVIWRVTAIYYGAS